MKARMDDFGAEIAFVHFAENAQARTGLQHLLLAGIEIEEAQQQRSAGIAHPRHQLAARPVGDFTVDHLDFELRGDAGPGVAQRRDARLVLVAQRQVQDEIAIALQAEPGQAARQRVALLRLSFQPRTSTASASTRAPRGNSLTPTAARAGKGWLKYFAMVSFTLAKLARSVR